MRRRSLNPRSSESSAKDHLQNNRILIDIKLRKPENKNVIAIYEARSSHAMQTLKSIIEYIQEKDPSNVHF